MIMLLPLNKNSGCSSNCNRSPRNEGKYNFRILL